MKDKFIFDVDGTLTPSRGIIDTHFKMFFNTFCLENDVYLVTGSDKPKTIEQLGEDTYNLCKRVYNCSGSDVWEQSKNVFTTDWILPEDAQEWLSVQLTESPYRTRTGLHFEHRPGMVNFSIVGRNANLEERAKYVAYDTVENERNLIASEFNKLFSGIKATVGGEISIDIAPEGSDKSQILRDISQNTFVHFFGDKQLPGGNDYTLAKTLLERGNTWCYNVINYNETWTILHGY